jgi:hypothetical protein
LNRTKAWGFSKLKIGSKIQFTIPIKRVGVGSGGTYATEVKVLFLDTNEHCIKSLNQLSMVLRSFDFK